MEKHCEFCSEPIKKYSRSTKKYCDDNCKQLAYYARHGKSWGTGEALKKDFAPEKLPFTVKPDFTLNGKPNDPPQSMPVFHHDLQNKKEYSENKTASIVKNFTVKDDPNEISNCNLSATSVTLIQEKEKSSEVIVKEKYQWVSSSLLDAIENYRIDSDAEYKFCNPEIVWGVENVSVFRWVSIRLRCLLENILRMSAHRFTHRGSVVEISRALNNLYDSCYFQAIQPHFPFSAMLVRLRQSFNEKVNQSGNEKISLRLSVDRKAELIAVRFMIADFAERKSFSQLNFSDGIKEEVARQYSQQGKK